MNSTGDASSLQTTSGTVFITINCVSVLVCLLAAILVFRLKLHRKVVYRLALYQVLSSLALSIVWLLNSVAPGYIYFCRAVGWFTLYCEWTKLLFTMWVTFHLFCFAVLHKNLQKLEVLYVVTSLVVPAVIACVPLITHTYASSVICYISGPANDSHHVALIERVVLWDVPAMVLLLATSISMIIMVIKLLGNVSQLHAYEPITDGDQFTKALKQLLPLVVFPILFFIFIIPQLVYDIHVFWSSTQPADQFPPTLIYFVTVFDPMWTLSSGVALLVHISVAICLSMKMRNSPSLVQLHEKQ